ncbi:MAG: DUF255 domain-containing protein [Phycisphaerales bacterium]|nr:DUF255 domain-containing protein [Planctomycetota bacterium]MBL6997146.1 DUF255 domain-containing protein [Phycisphaerales bacterium]
MSSSATNEQTGQDQTPALPSDGTNRLGETTSPYLLQHQHNPVHWYPWGEEAFEAARSQNKPIFLSIGYSTCYWCHVMERECFEDQEVADILNKDFIAIKVDREERPDVDDIYMTAVQIITRGRGGWPISLFLEPEHLQPFFGGTYFPKNDSSGRRGFISTMNLITQKWQDENESVMKQATLVGEAVSNSLTTKHDSVPLDADVIERGVVSLLSRYDSKRGGFSNAPKFPMPSYLDFLMETSWETPQVQTSVANTLIQMSMGGMYDQVGGGFHRYSTDDKWLVPHFEKMLYDNGQLVSTYAEAYKRTGNPIYAKVIEETLDYVNRELSDPNGGFLSAQDAESNHLEGETYLWRQNEIEKALSDAGMENEIEFTLAIYGVDQEPNFQDPHHPEVPPANVLFLTSSLEELASRYGMTYPELQQRIDAIDAVLLKVRDTRDQPSTDDKIITAWNGMMITGYADAGRILSNPEWVSRAEHAASFILDEMRSGTGKLLRTWRNGKGGAEAFLIDYSALIHGLLAIHRANQSQQALQQAIELYDIARSLFYVQGEGWYDTEDEQSDLFVRTRAQSDGAMPSATSLILLDQIDLAKLSGDSRFLDDAIRTIESESKLLTTSPLSAVVATRGLHTLLQRYPETFAEDIEVVNVDSSPVTMHCQPNTLTVPAGGNATVQVKIKIIDGWHVNSHSPGNDYAVPLSITSLDETVSLSMMWPKGKRMLSAGERVVVYSGPEVSIPVNITASERAKGPVAISVTWQACDEDSCLAPETIQIPCKIVVE